MNEPPRPSISFNIATFLYIDSTTMSMRRPLFLRFMILDHKLQRMLNDSKIAQLNSERPLHQTAVVPEILTLTTIPSQGLSQKYSIADLTIRNSRICTKHLQLKKQHQHICRRRGTLLKKSIFFFQRNEKE